MLRNVGLDTSFISEMSCLTAVESFQMNIIILRYKECPSPVQLLQDTGVCGVRIHDENDGSIAIITAIPVRSSPSKKIYLENLRAKVDGCN